MSKRLALLLALVAVALWMPASASAHVLIKDTSQQTGAVLHVNPDDDPIAGETASLYFDIQDSSIKASTSTTRFTVTDGAGTTRTVASQLRGSGVSVDYIFPHQGQYRLRLVVERQGATTHEFLYSQRVGRGVMGESAGPVTPLWAEVGLIFASLGLACTFIIVFNRRKVIQQYSKW